MDCPRCGLNNMPGSTVCFQCGADMTYTDHKTVTYPPRARKSGLKEGVRREKMKSPPFSLTKCAALIGIQESPFFSILPYLGIGFLSIFPGLAQFKNKKHKKGFVCAGLAIILVIIMIAFYNHIFFNLIFATFLFLQFFSILDGTFSALPETLKAQFTSYLCFSLTAFIITGIFLGALFIMILFNRIFILLRINTRILQPAIAQGETVLSYRYAYTSINPARGDYIVVQDRYRGIARVLGLPGEHISFKNNDIFIDNQMISQEDFLINHDLPKRDKSDYILNDTTYLVIDYSFNYLRLLTLKKEDVMAKAIAIYSPLENRRLIRGKKE